MEHKLRHNHDFDWYNVKIFLEKNYFCEMLNIQLQKNELNYQTDTEYLQHTHQF